MSKQIITKSSFLQDLEDGLTRKEMAEKYGTTVTGIAKGIKIFGLENSKPKKKFDLEFVDDTVGFEEVHITQEQIAEKAAQIEEIVNENIQEEQMEPLATDIMIDIFGVTPEMEKEAFENGIPTEPTPQPTFEDLGLSMISNYQD
jgi:hypothetical protein